MIWYRNKKNSFNCALLSEGLQYSMSIYTKFAEFRWDSVNPYKASVLFVGRRQIVQTQIKRRRTRRLTRGLHCLLAEWSVVKI